MSLEICTQSYFYRRTPVSHGQNTSNKKDGGKFCREFINQDRFGDLSRWGVLPTNLQGPVWGRWHQAPGKRENFSPPSLAAYSGPTYKCEVISNRKKNPMLWKPAPSESIANSPPAQTKWMCVFKCRTVPVKVKYLGQPRWMLRLRKI